MNIAVFTYDFPTSKTHDHWMYLLAHGWMPSLVLAAPPVNLGLHPAVLRQAPQGRILKDPSKLAELSGAHYHVGPHNSPETCRQIRKCESDLGIILGARILSQEVISSFKIGILNLHPGILPEVRGLDTLKWPLFCKLPLGVTAHLIDRRIDRGFLLARRRIESLPGDTLIDLQIRLWDLERELMIESLVMLSERGTHAIAGDLGPGEYFRQIPEESEEILSGSGWGPRNQPQPKGK